jgi:hypothetical protein
MDQGHRRKTKTSATFTQRISVDRIRTYNSTIIARRSSVSSTKWWGLHSSADNIAATLAITKYSYPVTDAGYLALDESGTSHKGSKDRETHGERFEARY